MTTMRLTASIIGFAILICSCARNRPDNNLPGVVVRVEPDSVPFEQTPDITRFTVNVIVRNDRTKTLYFGGCWPAAQQEIDGQWQTVWSPVCIQEIGGSLAPGDSLKFPFSAARFAHENVYPRLDPKATAGKYRLLLAATYDGPAME